MSKDPSGTKLQKELTGEVLPHGALRGEKLAPSMSHWRERNPPSEVEIPQRSGKEIIVYQGNYGEEHGEEQGLGHEEHGEEHEEYEGVGGDEKQPSYIKKKQPPKTDHRVLKGIDSKGPFPGGPEDNTLLVSFYDHIGLRITIGDDRNDLLKVINHSTKLSRWNLNDECEAVREKFQQTGLAPLCHLFASTNKLITTAFVERWHPETNSFHLPIGEMTITLEDVERITGLKIDGKLLIDDKKKLDQASAKLLVKRILDIEDELVDKEMTEKIHSNGTIRLDWLMEQMKGKAKNNDRRSVTLTVRAYCLYVLGCTIFSDKSGSGVYVGWLRFLRDVDKLKDIAWGTAALVYLYRQLGIATRGHTKQIAGYLVLLEVWVYEHFPSLFRGVKVQNYTPGTPLMLKYKENPVFGEHLPLLKNLRLVLDQLNVEGVIFDPYENDQPRDIPKVSLFRGFLVCADTEEVYLPDRVVRQFGYVQNCPIQPIVPKKARRVNTGRGYMVNFSKPKNFVVDKWNDERRLFNIDLRKYQKTNFAWECEDNYLEWFTMSSHVRITPKDSEASQPIHERQKSFNNLELAPKLKEAYSLSKELMKTSDNTEFRVVKSKFEKLFHILAECVETSSSATGDDDEDVDPEQRTKKKHNRPSKKRKT